MVAYSGKRAADSENMISKINNKEWGLLLLDEVHVVPANTFRQVRKLPKISNEHEVLTKVRAQTKLGLTATLVREDEMIQVSFFVFHGLIWGGFKFPNWAK